MMQFLPYELRNDRPSKKISSIELIKIFFFVVHSIATQAQGDPLTLIEEQEHLVLWEKCNILPSVVEPATGVARINGFCALHITWIQSF